MLLHSFHPLLYIILHVRSLQSNNNILIVCDSILNFRVFFFFFYMCLKIEYDLYSYAEVNHVIF